MKRYILILTCMLPLVLGAQISDDTRVSEKQIAFDTNFVPNTTNIEKANIRFDVACHIVLSSSDLMQIDTATIKQAFTFVNNALAPIGVSFNPWKFNMVENYYLNTLDTNNRNKLISETQLKNVLNIYFVNNLYNNYNANVCSYTFMPGDSTDQMFFQKNCFDSLLLIRQVGHYLNLYNTHDTIFGIENIARNNCYKAGDKCCDTPADPDLSKPGMLSACQYIGNVQYNGEFYIPDLRNYMSNTPDNCNKCFFSNEQYLRMLNAAMQTKTHLW